MDEQKEKFNWQRLGYIAAAVIVTALVVGGVTWYLMDARNNTNEKQFSKDLSDQLKSSDKQIQSLQKDLSNAIAPAAVTKEDSLVTIEKFCAANNNGTTPTAYSYMKTLNGEYVDCPLDNAMLIGVKVSGVWTKIFAGNGVISQDLCNQYKLPNKISGGTCNY